MKSKMKSGFSFSTFLISSFDSYASKQIIDFLLKISYYHNNSLGDLVILKGVNIMSRSCLKCGTKVSNDVTTCTSCGQPIKPVEPIEEKSNNTIFYIVLGIIIGIVVLIFAVIIPLVTD